MPKNIIIAEQKTPLPKPFNTKGAMYASELRELHDEQQTSAGLEDDAHDFHHYITAELETRAEGKPSGLNDVDVLALDISSDLSPTFKVYDTLLSQIPLQKDDDKKQLLLNAKAKMDNLIPKLVLARELQLNRMLGQTIDLNATFQIDNLSQEINAQGIRQIRTLDVTPRDLAIKNIASDIQAINADISAFTGQEKEYLNASGLGLSRADVTPPRQPSADSVKPPERPDPLQGPESYFAGGEAEPPTARQIENYNRQMQVYNKKLQDYHIQLERAQKRDERLAPDIVIPSAIKQLVEPTPTSIVVDEIKAAVATGVRIQPYGLSLTKAAQATSRPLENIEGQVSWAKNHEIIINDLKQNISSVVNSAAENESIVIVARSPLLIAEQNYPQLTAEPPSYEVIKKTVDEYSRDKTTNRLIPSIQEALKAGGVDISDFKISSPAAAGIAGASITAAPSKPANQAPPIIPNDPVMDGLQRPEPATNPAAGNAQARPNEPKLPAIGKRPEVVMFADEFYNPNPDDHTVRPTIFDNMVSAIVREKPNTLFIDWPKNLANQVNAYMQEPNNAQKKEALLREFQRADNTIMQTYRNAGQRDVGFVFSLPDPEYAIKLIDGAITAGAKVELTGLPEREILAAVKNPENLIEQQEQAAFEAVNAHIKKAPDEKLVIFSQASLLLPNKLGQDHGGTLLSRLDGVSEVKILSVPNRKQDLMMGEYDVNKDGKIKLDDIEPMLKALGRSLQNANAIGGEETGGPTGAGAGASRINRNATER